MEHLLQATKVETQNYPMFPKIKRKEPLWFKIRKHKRMYVRMIFNYTIPPPAPPPNVYCGMNCKDKSECPSGCQDCINGICKTNQSVFLYRIFVHQDIF